MQSSPAFADSRFLERVARIIKKVKHKRTQDARDMELVRGIRLEAQARASGNTRLTEEYTSDKIYDNSSNCRNIMTYYDGEFVSTFRIHVGGGENAILPSLSKFHDVLHPFLRHGCTFVDATQMASRLRAAMRLPELPYLTMRAILLSARHYKADIVTLPCVHEHETFYRRLGFESLGPPRSVPRNGPAVVCMALDYRAAKPRIEARYPLFQSTERERRGIFGPAFPLAAME